MSIRKLRAGRVPTATVMEYIGEHGSIFWDEAAGILRLSDGSTPGGLPIPITIATAGTTGSVKPGNGLKVAVDGTMSIDATSSFAFVGNKLSLLAATDTMLGGVKLGPGVITNGDGQIIIDSAGLDFSFGDFAALTGTYPADYFETERQSQDYAILSSVTANEDVVLASNGTGAVRVVGDFSVRRANGSLAGALDEQPIFRVKSDGQVRMLVPAADTSEGAVTIVGGLDAVFQAPINTGVMLHITGIAGTPGVPSRLYNDAQNAFAAFVARRYNNTAVAPTAVLDGEEIMRISGTAHNGTTIPSSGNQRIIYKALGNQTLTNQGGTIEFWATPQNTTTIAKVASIDNVNGITSTKFTGPLTGNVTGKADTAGNADTVTNGVYTTGSYANPSWITSLAASKVGLGSVENTALSTWAGSSNITTVGTLTNLSVTNTITGSINGTAGIATTVTLVATNTTDATHYLTFVDSATGNENVRTDTGLTYNPSTNVLTAGRGTFTQFSGKFIRNVRDAGTIADGGTLTIDFTTDAVVHCVWGNGMTLAYQNYLAGSVVRIVARKATGTGVDNISLDGIPAANVSTGSTTTGNYSADTTNFIELTCIGTTINDVYIKL